MFRIKFKSLVDLLQRQNPIEVVNFLSVLAPFKQTLLKKTLAENNEYFPYLFFSDEQMDEIKEIVTESFWQELIKIIETQ
ncbi:MAG: hypothetical protein PHT40_04570 [Patescibacteria group bacterium]|nr:hypothetical protein [Patescibacteria group bacterium]